MNRYRTHMLICGGEGCGAEQSAAVRAALVDALERHGAVKEAQVVTAGCFGSCGRGVVIKLHPENMYYENVSPGDADEIVREHVLHGRPVERLLAEEGRGAAQVRVALKNCGVIDPEKIEDYVAAGGYEALAKALTRMTPAEVIDAVTESGLRGRGGAGFPTGVKWALAAKTESEKKYVVCNADEGDPGAFMDRSILEGDPHRVLEAMAVAGYAIGADEGIVYIRAEYPLAVERLEKAIARAEALGLLGENILGAGHNFRVSLSLGAGAFVCGEETSLLNSIQGLRGEPRVKPPFPAQSGLWNAPTVINNVETLACVCPVILNGADWFRQNGTEKSPGTKVFALAGKLNNVGLAEVPMGTTVRDIVYNVGGGIRGGKKFKALQTGGPSGGCVPEEQLDLPLDYESLQAAGSMMGSGGLIVMDEDDCMVNIAKFYLEFTLEESCGKCTPCRIGNTRLYETLDRITKGKGKPEDLHELKELGNIIKDCSLCGLGQAAPNPVLSTIRYFHDEYVAHIERKKCPAGVCKDLLTFFILPGKCIGCTVCARNCPVSCIAGERKSTHVIDQERCVKCGTCYAKCPVNAIIRE